MSAIEVRTDLTVRLTVFPLRQPFLQSAMPRPRCPWCARRTLLSYFWCAQLCSFLLRQPLPADETGGGINSGRGKSESTVSRSVSGVATDASGPAPATRATGPPPPAAGSACPSTHSHRSPRWFCRLPGGAERTRSPAQPSQRALILRQPLVIVAALRLQRPGRADRAS